MLNSEQVKIVVVPPWENAGEDHWMSRWQSKYPGIERVEQSDWNKPRLSDWVAALDAHLSRQEKPVVVVAHSLGAATVARWAVAGGRVKAAFLVAPPDLEQADTPDEIKEFGPLPAAKLGFPSMLLASENDPYISIERARYFADAWGSEFFNIGEAGHVNPRSGYGEWAVGEEMLNALIRRQTSAMSGGGD